MWRYTVVSALFTIAILLTIQSSYGQDGTKGIDKANELVRQYFERGIYLLYAIGAVLGLVGAVKVYSKWSQGDPDTSKTAASWFGSCIFLVVVATVLKSFFGV
jgi:hypothetical protein